MGQLNKILKQVQNDKVEEAGRSMVEMLGVLAVIGVLSVGGVAMYTSAMNKHRANEILNEASKRAVMVAGQLLTNPSATTMSLAQFGSNAVAGGTFGENAAIANGKITLTVSGVETAICTQMKAATGDNAAMVVDDNCTKITFNTDMSRGVTEATGNTSICNGNGYKNSSDNCVCYPGYSGTECATATCTSGMYCGSGVCCAADEICTSTGEERGYCVKNTTGCTTNESCNDSSKYCKVTGTEGGYCITGGTCESKDDTWIPVEWNNRTFWVGPAMTKWAARNYCLAHNKRLASIGSIGLGFYENHGSNGPLFSAFNAKGCANDDFWLTNDNDACISLAIKISDGDQYIHTSNNSSTANKALCE